MIELVSFGAYAVFAVVFWLFKIKHEAQSAQIKLLFEKFDLAAAAHQELRLQIARDHYHKVELDARFERLEEAFKDGFRELGAKFDKLSDILLRHMSDEERRP